MSTVTVDVHSDIAICIEVGLERGVYAECKIGLGPGPNYRSFDLVPGLNRDVPHEIIATWLRKNRRFLECIKQNRIRIVEREAAASAAA